MAMFAVGETPWHREGVLLNEAPSFEEAMRLSGTDYEVRLVPIYVDDHAEGAVRGISYKEVPLARATLRVDRNTVLNTVGLDYRPLQNRDAFEVLTPLLDNGVAKLETGGTLREGADAWMLVRFAIDDPVVRDILGDEVVPFGLISNNHTCGRRAQVKMTPVRVVCANTLGMAHRGSGDAIFVRHVGDARLKIVDAATKMFEGIVERYRTIAEQYRLMKETRFTVDQFTATVLDVLAPLPEAKDKEAKSGFDRALANAEAKRRVLTTAWTGGKGHKADHSAWEAYNGAVETIDHDDDTYTVRGSRALALLDGRLGTAKDEVLESIMVECKKR
jgi:phage/plasmid-like protein (TIGR03299 family)